MKVVTVTTKHGIPLVFLSTDVIEVQTVLDFDFGWSDWEFVRKEPMLYSIFFVRLKNKGWCWVYGNINDFGETCENGGTLKSTEEEHERLLKINSGYYS